jgi:hypothetical protein
MEENNINIEELLQKAKHHQMTPEELRDQKISFAWGNLNLHNPQITRRDVEDALDRRNLL